MVNVILIRHGRQDSSLCNVDVPLSEAGRKQAQLCGERLKKLYDIKRIYSSKLMRAVETAGIINEYLQVPYESYKELEEIDYGSLTGLTDEAIKASYSEFVKERKDSLSDIPFPNGENGEDVYNRAFPIIRNIAVDCENNGAENVAIVTHGGLIRAMLAGISGAGFGNKLLFAEVLENTSLTVLRYNSDRERFTIERVNDFSHIENEELLLRKYF